MADLTDDDLARIWAKLDPDRWPITASGLALARAAIAEDRALNGTQSAPVAQAERAGWQPIETAPKDGTHIIALRPTDPAHIEGMYWANYEDGGGAWHWSYDGDSPNGNHPTHWMPIPAAPPPDQTKG